MIKFTRDTGKKFAAVGAIVGFVAASLQTRRLMTASDEVDDAPAGALALSKDNLKIVVGKTRCKTYICFMTARQSFFGTYFYYFFFW